MQKHTNVISLQTPSSIIPTHPIPVIQPVQTKQKRSSLWNPLFDFWAIGGLSLLLCVVCHIANIFRDAVPVFEMRFMQMLTVFSVFSILCNHPHFLVSYRFGYGRGLKFIFKNWFALLFVPLTMIALYTLAYFKFDLPIPNSPIIDSMNSILATLGLKFHIGESSKLGAEIVGLSIWVMYFTVGWHYCKQVYGCMMVYAFYGEYKLTSLQKNILKSSVFAVAFYQLIFMVNTLDSMAIGESVQDSRFRGFYMSVVGLPEGLKQLSIFAMVICTALALGVFVFNYQKSKKVPPINFLVPWIAFYVWWIPFRDLPEFYLIMVPFFHSLQYLPFAFRVEKEKIKKDRWFNIQASVRIILLLGVGFASFELVPAILDKSLSTEIYQSAWFFTSVFAVFLNIHHFFIDSVVWKFDNEEIHSNLLFKTGE